jgi:uridine phosphorylase
MDMTAQEFPILEFDSDRNRIIDPDDHHRRTARMPSLCVLCFFQDAITAYARKHRAVVIARHRNELCVIPLFRTVINTTPIAFMHAGLGAPLAAAVLEEAVSLGATRFVVCGGAGVLDRSIKLGKLIVPVAAVRDEGTSYHYCAPGREIEPTLAMTARIKKTLKRNGVGYLEAKTWTTDAFYRETKAKIDLRKSEGCLTVEMEASALFAVARYRNVEIGQILYAGDDVSGDVWDKRGWHSRRDIRLRLLELALEACLEP